MADNSILGDIGEGLGKALPYALSAALGAKMGGGLGALAGVGMAKGGEAQYGITQQQKQLELAKFQLEQQKAKSEEGARQATLQLHKDALTQRVSDDQWRQMTKLNEDQFHQQYAQTMAGLAQQAQQTRQQIAMTADQTRKDALQQSLDTNMWNRAQGARSGAEHAAEHATDHRGFWEAHFGSTKKLSDQELHDKVFDDYYANQIKSYGWSREQALDHGVDSNIVDKIYPKPSAASAKLQAKSAGTPAAKPLKSMKGGGSISIPKDSWGKTLVGPDGRKWSIDSSGKPTPAS